MLQNDATHISFPFVSDCQEDLIQLIQLFLWVPRCGVDWDQHNILQHCDTKLSIKLQILISHYMPNHSMTETCAQRGGWLTDRINLLSAPWNHMPNYIRLPTLKKTKNRSTYRHDSDISQQPLSLEDCNGNKPMGLYCVFILGDLCFKSITTDHKHNKYTDISAIPLCVCHLTFCTIKSRDWPVLCGLKCRIYGSLAKTSTSFIWLSSYW